MRSLYSRNHPEECAVLDVTDTLMCEGGSPLHYIYTSPNNGSVMGKSGRFISMPVVRREFLRLVVGAHLGGPQHLEELDRELDGLSQSQSVGGKSTRNGDNDDDAETGGGKDLLAEQYESMLPHGAPVCLVHKQGGDVLALDASKFTAMCKNGPPADAVALQAYCGRGPACANSDGTDSFANLRHEYRLSAVGIPSMAAFKLGVNKGTTGVVGAVASLSASASQGGGGALSASGGASSVGGRSGGSGGGRGAGAVACRDEQANKSMNAAVQQLVRCVERKKRCRVVSMVTEFTVDVVGRVWLHKTTETLTSVDGPSSKALNSKQGNEEQRRANRTSGVSAVGKALTTDQPLKREELSEANHYGVDVGRSRGGGGGTKGGVNTEVRAARRRARDAPPDEAAVQQIMASLDEEKEGLSTLFKANALGSALNSSLSAAPLAPDGKPMPRIANSEYRKQQRGSAAHKALGSTQLPGVFD